MRGAVVALVLLASVACAGERIASTQVGERRVTLELRVNEPVLVLRGDGPLSVEVVRSAMPALLSSLFSGDALPDDVRSLSAPRIETLPWLSERLALAAAKDPDWEATRGEARRGHENAVVGALLQREELARELAAPFARYGLVATSVSVEKVLVAPASRLPFADRLRAAGVTDGARLPFDAQLWLRFGAR
jgi:hypothetical protein